MNKREYEMLREERDRLVSLQSKASLAKHKDMINEQLKLVRGELKKAHREDYYANAK